MQPLSLPALVSPVDNGDKYLGLIGGVEITFRVLGVALLSSASVKKSLRRPRLLSEWPGMRSSWARKGC